MMANDQFTDALPFIERRLSDDVNPVPVVTSRLGKLSRFIPSERSRAVLLLLLGGIAGYVAPVFVGAVTDRFQFPLESAKIEQLRVDVARVPCAIATQVLANVIAANQEIVRKQVESRLWYSTLFVSSHWQSVQLVPVPCEEP